MSSVVAQSFWEYPRAVLANPDVFQCNDCGRIFTEEEAKIDHYNGCIWVCPCCRSDSFRLIDQSGQIEDDEQEDVV